MQVFHLGYATVSFAGREFVLMQRVAAGRQSPVKRVLLAGAEQRLYLDPDGFACGQVGQPHVLAKPTAFEAQALNKAAVHNTFIGREYAPVGAPHGGR